MKNKTLFEQFLPLQSIPFLEKWIGEEELHIHIRKERKSKLGDYTKVNGMHKITINAIQNPELFFLVLTHELAHLIALKKYGRSILPHGKEWKLTFGDMIKESLEVYASEAHPMLLEFSKSPKANFMAFEKMVRYFYPQNHLENGVYVEQLLIGDEFIYRKNKFQVLAKRRRNYLCVNLNNKRQYIFKAVTTVVPIKCEEKCY